jgi:large subunit ribosomal protein L18
MLKSIQNSKRSLRVRKKIKKVSTDRYRVSIHRSAKNIFAQIIDDTNSKTLVSASSLKDKTEESKKKMDSSAKVAVILAKKAIEKKITKVYFDRGSYKYHGRVKIFADTLRKNGLTF